MSTRRLVLLAGVVIWAVLMALLLATGDQVFLYAALVVIVAQVVASIALGRS